MKSSSALRVTMSSRRPIAAFAGALPLAGALTHTRASSVCRGAPSVRRPASVAVSMSISSAVSSRLKDAMKAKRADEVRALRLIRAAFLTKQKEDGGDDELDDAAAVAVLRKLAKMRRESIEMFTQGGRDELVAVEERDLGIVEEYLPKLADEATTRKWAEEAIEKSGAKGSAQAGKAIGALMKNHRGVRFVWFPCAASPTARSVPGGFQYLWPEYGHSRNTVANARSILD